MIQIEEQHRNPLFRSSAVLFPPQSISKPYGKEGPIR
jgi:hypothetical protein